MSFSTIDCFDIAYCTHKKVPKQKIGGWIDFHYDEPPPTPTGANLQNSPVDQLSDFVPPGHLNISAKICADTQIASSLYQEPKCVSAHIFLLRDRRYEQRSRSNLGSDFGLLETLIVAAPPTDAMFAPRFCNRLHLLNPPYPWDGSKA